MSFNSKPTAPYLLKQTSKSRILFIKKNSFLSLFSLLFLLLLPFFSIAQDETKKGMDERINDWFKPIADWWGGIIFFPITIGGFAIPFVVILLISGALFFTIYFTFVNIRRFGLAVRVVRGKYDYLDKDAPHIKPPEDMPADTEGDLLGTI
ncbi:MAG: hypothetical protein M3413_00060, partial [Bacteroidota bacterium]|nr:hypothetical protein [Bacteroidota bacterium]